MIEDLDLQEYKDAAYLSLPMRCRTTKFAQFSEGKMCGDLIVATLKHMKAFLSDKHSAEARESVLEETTRQISAIYSSILLKHANYRAFQAERIFFESMADFITSVAVRVFPDHHRVAIENEVSRMLRTDSFNLTARKNDTKNPSNFVFLSRELFLLRRATDVIGDKLVAILHPRKAIGDSVLHAIPKRSPLISSLVPRPCDSSSHLFSGSKDCPPSTRPPRPSSAPPRRSTTPSDSPFSSRPPSPARSHTVRNLGHNATPTRTWRSRPHTPIQSFPTASKPPLPKSHRSLELGQEAEGSRSPVQTGLGSPLLLRHKRTPPARPGKVSAARAEKTGLLELRKCTGGFTGLKDQLRLRIGSSRLVSSVDKYHLHPRPRPASAGASRPSTPNLNASAALSFKMGGLGLDLLDRSEEDAGLDETGFTDLAPETEPVDHLGTLAASADFETMEDSEFGILEEEGDFGTLNSDFTAAEAQFGTF